jgi:2-amino-4-hydroxy-6-hydroxymethyldihydropteridine diphosphokinase
MGRPVRSSRWRRRSLFARAILGRVMRVAIALGSNVGDRIASLRDAVRRVGEHARARVVRTSRVYETAAIGGPEQGAFLNAAILVEWEGEPLALLDVLQEIERDLGRTRDVRWGPRTIDLDVLWIEGNVTIDDARLVVPHPRLAERAFAVTPLLDVVPDAPFAVPSGQDVALVDASLTEP